MTTLYHIEKAFQRLELAGHKDTEYYNNLKAKRDAVKAGKGRVVDVTEETIGSVGGLFARISRAHRLKKFDIDRGL